MPCLALEENIVGHSLLCLKDCAPVMAVLDNKSDPCRFFLLRDRKWGSDNSWQLLDANVSPSTAK